MSTAIQLLLHMGHVKYFWFRMKLFFFPQFTFYLVAQIILQMFTTGQSVRRQQMKQKIGRLRTGWLNASKAFLFCLTSYDTLEGGSPRVTRFL